jgi:hypothetical protein
MKYNVPVKTAMTIAGKAMTWGLYMKFDKYPVCNDFPREGVLEKPKPKYVRLISMETTDGI